MGRLSPCIRWSCVGGVLLCNAVSHRSRELAAGPRLAGAVVDGGDELRVALGFVYSTSLPFLAAPCSMTAGT
jgi:hypothetical protein